MQKFISNLALYKKATINTHWYFQLLPTLPAQQKKQVSDDYDNSDSDEKSMESEVSV